MHHACRNVGHLQYGLLIYDQWAIIIKCNMQRNWILVCLWWKKDTDEVKMCFGLGIRPTLRDRWTHHKTPTNSSPLLWIQLWKCHSVMLLLRLRAPERMQLVNHFQSFTKRLMFVSFLFSLISDYFPIWQPLTPYTGGQKMDSTVIPFRN